MKTPSLWMIVAGCFMALASVAHARPRSAYDGSWDLAFVTQIQRIRGKIWRGSRVSHGS
jgi:hypothetical protein